MTRGEMIAAVDSSPGPVMLTYDLDGNLGRVLVDSQQVRHWLHRDHGLLKTDVLRLESWHQHGWTTATLYSRDAAP